MRDRDHDSLPSHTGSLDAFGPYGNATPVKRLSNSSIGVADSLHDLDNRQTAFIEPCCVLRVPWSNGLLPQCDALGAQEPKQCTFRYAIVASQRRSVVPSVVAGHNLSYFPARQASPQVSWPGRLRWCQTWVRRMSSRLPGESCQFTRGRRQERRFT
jgi:hypothetical protein